MTDYPQYPADPSQPGAGAPATRGPRPEPVDLAVKLIWALIGLSVIGALVTFLLLDQIVDQALADAGIDAALDADTVRSGALIGAVVGLVISVGLFALLAVFIGKGANWARITYTVLAGLGLLLNLVGLAGGGTSAQPLALDVVGLVSIVLTAAVLVLLWRKESNAWFATPRVPQG